MHQSLKQNTHYHTFNQGVTTFTVNLSQSQDSLLTSVHISHHGVKLPVTVSIFLDGVALALSVSVWRAFVTFRFMRGLSAGSHTLQYEFTAHPGKDYFDVVTICENIVSPGMKSDFSLFDKLFKAPKDPAKPSKMGRIPLVDVVRPPDTDITIIPWWAPRAREVLSFSWSIVSSVLQGSSELYSAVIPRPFMILSYQIFQVYSIASAWPENVYATHAYTVGFLGQNESLPPSASSLAHPVFFSDGVPSDLTWRGWYMAYRVWAVAPLSNMRIGVRLNYTPGRLTNTYAPTLVFVIQYL